MVSRELFSVSGLEECVVERGMCRYILECVGMLYIVSVTGSLWNAMECVWNAAVACGMSLYRI